MNKNIVSFVSFLLIFGLSLGAFVYAIITGDLMKIGLAAAALFVYLLPMLIKKFWKLELSPILEISFYLFVFAALILGEVFAFYGPFLWWDVVLHFLSGFLLAGVGASLVEIFAKGKQKKFFTLFVAFCFSVTAGIVWECVEFTFDMTVRTDAQKDAHVRQISTITMQRDGGNQPVRINDIEKTELYLENGEIVTIDEGFLDIGLLDTMKDIFINIAGAGIFCIVGAGLGRKKMDHFALTKIS